MGKLHFFPWPSHCHRCTSPQVTVDKDASLTRQCRGYRRLGKLSPSSANIFASFLSLLDTPVSVPVHAEVLVLAFLRSTNSGSWSVFWFPLWSAMWPWASYITSLGFSSLIKKGYNDSLIELLELAQILYVMQVLSLGQEDPLEEGMAIHSSIFAWRIPWTEEPGGLKSMGSESWTWLRQLSTTHVC